jgi:hypothetical protein
MAQYLVELNRYIGKLTSRLGWLLDVHLSPLLGGRRNLKPELHRLGFILSRLISSPLSCTSPKGGIGDTQALLNPLLHTPS